ncbi:OadG family protein [Maribellus maritimus]|uniref:OadG family protein n=1 Tax=Maribellus maritimus TaxID=2870838 RepID=UPI001EEB9599|nr:OadG family protein [Maribellus maritimus]MCG6189581.1 OadG family protein [Maribellus maritimus]
MNLLFTLLASSVEFGYTVTIVGFSIVFFALTLLVVVFLRLPKIVNINLKKMFRKKGEEEAHKEEKEDDYIVEGNVTAAISMALHLYFDEMHDEESNIVTIKRVRKAYSPWSSKIYSVTQNWPKQ